MKKIIWALAIIVVVYLVTQTIFSQKITMKIGDKAPAFELFDQDGNLYSSRQVLGKQPLVLYFYPKDDTPGCTKQACKFRDEFEAFTDMGVTVIGISNDDVVSHKKFALKYKLPFTLLADVDNVVRKAFGVPKSLLGLVSGRTTYIINKEGVVIDIFNHLFNAENHINEALNALKN